MLSKLQLKNIDIMFDDKLIEYYNRIEYLSVILIFSIIILYMILRK